MPARKNKNKIAVFLIKTQFKDFEDIVDNFDALEKEEIKNGDEIIGTLYFSESKKSEPNWLKRFFGIDTLGDISFCNSNTRAVFLTEVDERVFALVFGYGKSLLKKDVCEDDFGLFTTLNLVTPNTLRSVDKVDLALSGKKTREQLIKSGEIKDFGVDIEQDLVNVVTGKCSVEDLGGIITGRDSFHVTIESDYKTIKGFLSEYLKYYKSEAYKENFAWINNIRKVDNSGLIEKLDEELVNRIKGENLDKIWLAVPEVIEWSGIEGFKYSKSSQDQFEDLHLLDFKAYLGDKLNDLDIKKLKCYYDVFRVYDFTKSEFADWSIYSCLYCETTLEGNYYILNNKNWYKINASFVSDINSRFDSVPKLNLGLPDYQENIFAGKGDDKGEGGYNKKVSEDNNDYILFDKKLIQIGGGNNKVEFCDLFSKSNKRLIHVKIYGGSSVLSHLFNQGLVSGELFLEEKSFRDGVNNILPADCKLSDTDSKPDATEYQIVFAIISSSAEEFNLPFFSKIALSNVCKRLRMLNYNVAISKIQKV